MGLYHNLAGKLNEINKNQLRNSYINLKNIDKSWSVEEHENGYCKG